jgi:hypothetical protein
MKPETLVALKTSIQHWEEMSNITSLNEIKIGARHCALCQLFNTPDDSCRETCVGCPVSARTGTTFCLNTPHEKALGGAIKRDLSVFIAAAKEELAFLKSLLPTNEQ